MEGIGMSKLLSFLRQYQRTGIICILTLVLVLLLSAVTKFDHGDGGGDLPAWPTIAHINGTVKMTQEGGKQYYFPEHLIPRLPWNEPTINALGQLEPAEKIYHEEMVNIEVECRYRRRMGRMDDGGWDICLVGPYKPQTNNCLVYSFGISNEWSFDDAMADDYGCEVHAFDPTVSLPESRRGTHIYFHPIGLYGSKTSLELSPGRTLPVDTLSNFVRAYGHEGRVIDYLKFDIEGSEWSALADMYASGILKYVKQIGLETHNGQGVYTAARYKELLAMLSPLKDFGFRRWHSHLNPYATFHSNVSKITIYYSNCQEMYYLNMNYLTKPLNVIQV